MAQLLSGAGVWRRLGQRPRRRRICLVSALATSVSEVRRRVTTEDFFSRMWFMPARRRRRRPVPVTLKRLAAPLWLFIFGMFSSPGLQRLLRRLGLAGRSARLGLGSAGPMP